MGTASIVVLAVNENKRSRNKTILTKIKPPGGLKSVFFAVQKPFFIDFLDLWL